MRTVLVAGASGSVGRTALVRLRGMGVRTRALVSSDRRARAVEELADEVFVGDARDRAALDGCCRGVDAVFSGLGKSMSPFRSDPRSFREVDYECNVNLLLQAVRHRVRRFLYVSMFGDERFSGFEPVRVHRDFEDALEVSGISHTIVRPVAFFNVFDDLLRMAFKGVAITLGRGESRTNPIHHEEVAGMLLDRIEGGERVLEAGGPEVFTRYEIGELICRHTGCGQHLRVPGLLAAAAHPVFGLYDAGFRAKFAFFQELFKADAIAPSVGERRLGDYLRVRTAEMALERAA